MFAQQIDIYLKDYLGIKDCSRVLFISTFPKDGLLAMVVNRSADISAVTDYKHSSAVDSEKLVDLFLGYDVISFVSEKSSIFPKETRAALKSLGDSRINAYRTFDFSEALFENCFNIPKIELKSTNDKLIHLLRNTANIFVRSQLGTNLRIKVDPRFLVINSCGDHAADYPGTLPPSEIATCSDFLEGQMVVDGAVNGNFRLFGDITLDKHPLTVRFEGDEIVSAHCDNKVIETQVHNFLQLENARKVGEVGIGTNYGHRGFIAVNSHINERFPSLHIGLGAHNQNETKLDWTCSKHLDLILGYCDVFFDDRLVLRDGHFLLDDIVIDPVDFRGDAFMDVF